MSLSQTPLYFEARHYFKNQFARLLLFTFLLLALFYNFNPEKCHKTNLQTWMPNELRSTDDKPVATHNDEVIDGLKMQPQIGKVHAVFGEPNPVYERALRLHEAHSDLMGHPMFVLRERLLSGLWSKPAFILSVMLQELAKPEDKRLQWLLYASTTYFGTQLNELAPLTMPLLSRWTDADIVVMNPNVPLEIFIPPHPEFSYVNMLVTNDRHGLNNGCFLIRINPWAVKLLSGVIAFHNFRPEVELKYTEQSALEEMIEDSYWRKAVVHVPQYWFNAYPASNKESATPRPHEFRPGGLQIHFAGNRDGKRSERMDTWMDIAEQEVVPYNAPLEQTGLLEDIRNFWAQLSKERTEKGIQPIQEMPRG